MARPSRCRRICLEPQYDRFIPDRLCESGTVLLSVDEYEAIRLIDLEKMTHEECANQMGISRTTVTETYEKARYKIADFLVNGKALNITGGNYRLCEGLFRQCCQRPCKRDGYKAGQPADHQKGASQMKIAVTYENGNIFQHFGHTEQFKLCLLYTSSYALPYGASHRSSILSADLPIPRCDCKGTEAGCSGCPPGLSG